MKTTIRTSLALSALILASAPSVSKAALAYTIQNGTTLVRFDTAAPGAFTTVGNFSGATSFVDGIDFRPANGLLYGYSFLANAVVTIDPSTAITSLASTPTTASTDFVLGIDFNPAADRLRLVNEADQNLRINVDTGATTVDGTLAYLAGDPNFGVNPLISEVAYTNNDNNPATGTTLYYIDTGTNSLVSTTNPNGGALQTVGALGLDVINLIGFDIVTDPFAGTNSAFAILDTGGVSAFYSINLASGAATLLGGANANGNFSLAITPTAVPEPGTALAGVALLGLCGLRRRRQVQA
jgi:hypothetical protein